MRPTLSYPRIGSQTKSSTTRRASSSHDPTTATPQSVSVQSSSRRTVRLHRVYFYIVPRKLIAKLQAFSQCIQETSMVRFHSSIYSDDKMLIRQMSRDSAFHGIPPPKSLPHIETKTECLGSVPDHRKGSLFRVRNSLFLAQRHDI